VALREPEPSDARSGPLNLTAMVPRRGRAMQHCPRLAGPRVGHRRRRATPCVDADAQCWSLELPVRFRSRIRADGRHAIEAQAFGYLCCAGGAGLPTSCPDHRACGPAVRGGTVSYQPRQNPPFRNNLVLWLQPL